MAKLTVEEVKSVFSCLCGDKGDNKKFFAAVADNVEWTVEGSHVLAGHYRSKAEFREKTFDRMSQVLSGDPQLKINHVLVNGEWAVVEATMTATAKNGLKFQNNYCWVTRFAEGKIVEVRAYLDSLIMQRVFNAV